jgi:A/G-specific adenine glycosylase
VAGRASTKSLEFDASSLCPPAVRRSIRRKLLAWYDNNKRDLPWRRRQDDPYAQWVAEIMLQQTRVETVLDYYERFLAKFPSVTSLATAHADRVLKQWEGLGYYRRAQNLQRACILLTETAQDIPTSARALRELPGIGTYTAAAISSIAFGKPEAAVDGNIARIVARLFERPQGITSTRGKGEIQQLADLLLSRSRPGDFNQAWMDLGSSICTPNSPSCERCPLRSNCAAHSQGTVEQHPARDAARSGRVVEMNVVVGLFRHREKLLVKRRPAGGIWSGLWEFPNANTQKRSASNRRLLRQLARDEGLSLEGLPFQVGPLEHRLTHRLIKFDVWIADVEAVGDANSAAQRRWVTERGLSRLTIPTGFRRVYKMSLSAASESA